MSDIPEHIILIAASDLAHVGCSCSEEASATCPSMDGHCRQQERTIQSAIIAAKIRAAEVEREACARIAKMSADQIRLMAGEMTAQEMRSVKAVLGGVVAIIRARGKIFSGGTL